MYQLSEDFYSDYTSRVSSIHKDNLYEWARERIELKNVLSGLCDECFGLNSDFDDNDEMWFWHISYKFNYPGTIIKLEFGEQNFFEYLLYFAMEVAQKVKKYEIINVYNLYIYYLRSLLETHGITTITSTELLDLKKRYVNPTLFIPSEHVILKTFDKVMFYRSALGKENFSGFEENVGYVYIMGDMDNGIFKIGYSKKPGYREGTLQSKQPKIKLLKVWKCDKSIEVMLHRYYKEKRIRGEWFRLDCLDLYNFNDVIQKMINKL